nr:phytoene desaturase family protein [Bacillus ectoiniformans]
MKIAVIGAGPGGLASAMLLASAGYQVDVYEKQSFIGGRNGAIEKDGYTFDIGPTFLSMPEIAEEIFEQCGRNLHDYIDLKELKMMYELRFDQNKIQMHRDQEKMKEQIGKVYPGNEKGYERFMSDTRQKMAKLKPILQSPMNKYHHYLRWNVLSALPHLSLGQTLHDVLSEYFSDEELRLAFTFQSKYLGMSPWECPGAFSILSFMEHEYGVYHPIGGLNQLPKAMAKVVKEYGGKIHLNTAVKKFKTQGRKVVGLELESGTSVEADEVVVNGDFAHVMTNLADEGLLKKYSREKLEKKKYSCSTFMIYLGVNQTFDLPHHTILFASDYRKNVEEVTGSMQLSADPSIYIQNASVTDPTLAPKGKSAIYILAPVPNNMSEIEWEKHEQNFRDLVLDLVEQKSEFKGLREHIEFEKIISPKDWEKDYFVYKGATFNLSHRLSQMMVFRPHNRFEELDHCWLVGGGTHPGSGLPTILESARITSNLIMKQSVQRGFIPLEKLRGML